MTFQDYHAELKKGTTKLELELDSIQLDKLIGYMNLLVKWNKTYNLTSIVEPQRIISHHLLDSLAIWKQVKGEKGIDVGTGAGLPGVPLAVCFPEKHFTLLDSNGKRCRFLTQSKIELRLDNIEVVHQRVQDYRDGEFDMVFSRAYSSLAKVVEDMQGLVTAKGILMAMRGKVSEQELSTISKTIKVLAVDRLQVPFLNEERYLVSMARS